MFKKLLQSRLFTFIGLAVIAFFLISAARLGQPLRVISKELKNLNQKINDAKNNSQQLDKLADYFKSDDYLERQARLKLNYKKPDEKVVFVYDGQNLKAENKSVQMEQKIIFFQK